jgi:arsenate reductase-like glutaredoxin family protein|tara:strand:+ start:817 stop:1083 length:267 start_codon:yes stop_codon:yes gene_type:complete
VEAVEVVNTRQTVLKEKDALALARQANVLFVAKGKKVVRLDMKKDKPDKQTLSKLLLGPTGNLRAPTLRVGKKLVVGFQEQMYHDVFG